MSTATPLEWFLAAVVSFGLLVMVWLLIDGGMDVYWVRKQSRKFLREDWSTASIQAWGHLWTLLGLTAVQAIFAAISLELLFTSPTSGPSCLCPPPPQTHAALLVRWGLIAAELILILVGVNLRIVRHRLFNNVERIGG